MGVLPRMKVGQMHDALVLGFHDLPRVLGEPAESQPLQWPKSPLGSVATRSRNRFATT
jgi:hypothetical protein